MTSLLMASTTTTTTRLRPVRVRFESASVGRSGPARRRWSARSARCSDANCRSSSSPTTSSRPRTPTRCGAAGVLPIDRIVAVETGCCPHTAIRDDIAANLDAVEKLEAAAPARRPDARRDRAATTSRRSSAVASSTSRSSCSTPPAATTCRARADPGSTLADLLVINKTDLAPYVGSDVARMVADAEARRDGRPVMAVSLAGELGASPIADWVRARCGAWRAGRSP